MHSLNLEMNCSVIDDLVIRPPVRSNGRSYKMIVMFLFFTAQCTLVQSAVLRSHVVRPSVCDVGGL